MLKTKTSTEKAPRAKRSRDRTARARAIEATLAAVAHDIRTPLTGILALSELLAASDLGERERAWAAEIRSTAEHIAQLTSVIVDAARADRKGLVLRRDPMQPHRMAESLAASLMVRAESKGLKSQSMLADDLPERAVGDPIRLRAAVENLIDNAVKFTEHGSVRLDVTCARAARRRLRLVFTVTDSGIGLSAAEMRRLFRPFVQANEDIARRFGGAGLGLVFVKRIAKAMGGDLTVTTPRDGGCRFRLTVLVERTDASAAADGGEGIAGARPVRALNILCAEDNPYGRVLLNTILTELGHHADFVGSGAAVVDAAARGGYDLILMDVVLPGTDGLEATRRIRALAPPRDAIPIVGISGRANAADETAGRAAGMDGYLAKPVSLTALTQVLAPLVAQPGRSRVVRPKAR